MNQAIYPFLCLQCTWNCYLFFKIFLLYSFSLIETFIFFVTLFCYNIFESLVADYGSHLMQQFLEKIRTTILSYPSQIPIMLTWSCQWFCKMWDENKDEWLHFFFRSFLFLTENWVVIQSQTVNERSFHNSFVHTISAWA